MVIEQRAETVLKILVELGVPESQLTAIGLGDDDPWHLDDFDVHGNYIESLASQNRKVLLLDAGSDEAKKYSINHYLHKLRLNSHCIHNQKGVDYYK